MSKRICAHITWVQYGQRCRSASVPLTVAMSLARTKHGDAGVSNVVVVLE